MPPLYRGEGRSLLSIEEEDASSISRIGTPSPLQRGGCLLSIEKRDPLSSSQRMSMPPLYREEGHSLCSSERRSMPPLYIEEGHFLLFSEEEYAASLSRRGTPSPLQRGGVCLLSVEKRDSLSSS